jgi:hypothetical protein
MSSMRKEKGRNQALSLKGFFICALPVLLFPNTAEAFTALQYLYRLIDRFIRRVAVRTAVTLSAVRVVLHKRTRVRA